MLPGEERQTEIACEKDPADIGGLKLEPNFGRFAYLDLAAESFQDRAVGSRQLQPAVGSSRLPISTCQEV